MNRPLVSVILPVFNGEAYLPQAIESVLAQSHRPIELIAVDDGSSDGSAEILTGYGSQLTVIRQANAGVSAARNAGFARATGEYIAFLDQDDWWLPEKAARQVELFQQNDRLGLVHTAASFFDESRKQPADHLNPAAEPERMVGHCYELLLLGNHLVNSSVMVRRSALDRVGLCDLSIQGNTVQDYDLWLRIAQEFEFGFVPEPLTTFRLHVGQGHRDRRAMLGEELKVLLRQRPQKAWRATSQGRRRLAQVCDSLAIAHFEAGDPREARRFFAQAVRMELSRRSLTRFGASCLPFALVRPLRQAWHERKLGSGSDSRDSGTPALANSTAKC